MPRPSFVSARGGGARVRLVGARGVARRDSRPGRRALGRSGRRGGRLGRRFPDRADAVGPGAPRPGAGRAAERGVAGPARRGGLELRSDAREIGQARVDRVRRAYLAQRAGDPDGPLSPIIGEPARGGSKGRPRRRAVSPARAPATRRRERSSSLSERYGVLAGSSRSSGPARRPGRSAWTTPANGRSSRASPSWPARASRRRGPSKTCSARAKCARWSGVPPRDRSARRASCASSPGRRPAWKRWRWPRTTSRAASPRRRSPCSWRRSLAPERRAAPGWRWRRSRGPRPTRCAPRSRAAAATTTKPAGWRLACSRPTRANGAGTRAPRWRGWRGTRPISTAPIASSRARAAQRRRRCGRSWPCAGARTTRVCARSIRRCSSRSTPKGSRASSRCAACSSSGAAGTRRRSRRSRARWSSRRGPARSSTRRPT